jgi:hypothetical protein
MEKPGFWDLGVAARNPVSLVGDEKMRYLSLRRKEAISKFATHQQSWCGEKPGFISWSEES